MRRVFIFLLLVSQLFGAVPNSHAQPEPPKLPADLLVMSGWKTFRIDAETLEATEMYADNPDLATIKRPVSWSPSGQYLAFLQPGGEVCILTRPGTVKRCFEDKVSIWDRSGWVGSSYMLTWADDEQSVYFLVDKGDLRSLVEADVNTGHIRRTLYQINSQGEVPPKIYWTPSMDTLFIDNKAVEDDFYSTRRPYGPDQWRGATLVHLPDNKTFIMPTELPELGELSFCYHFSPSGHYLVARAFTATEPPFVDDDMLPSFVVFDLQGNVLYTIARSQLQVLELFWADCPSWQPDEQAFYFLAGRYNESETGDEAYILKYSLSDNSLVQYAQVLSPLQPTKDARWAGEVISQLVVSSDGDCIVLEVSNILLEPGKFVDQLAVVFPTGEVIRLSEQYQTAPDPIWIPPLQAN